MSGTFWGAFEEGGIECAISDGMTLCGKPVDLTEETAHKSGHCCEKCMNIILGGGGANATLLEYPKECGSFQRWQKMLEAASKKQLDQFECKGCADIVGDEEKR